MIDKTLHHSYQMNRQAPVAIWKKKCANHILNLYEHVHLKKIDSNDRWLGQYGSMILANMNDESLSRAAY